LPLLSTKAEDITNLTLSKAYGDIAGGNMEINFTGVLGPNLTEWFAGMKALVVFPGYYSSDLGRDSLKCFIDQLSISEEVNCEMLWNWQIMVEAPKTMNVSSENAFSLRINGIESF